MRARMQKWGASSAFIALGKVGESVLCHGANILFYIRSPLPEDVVGG